MIEMKLPGIIVCLAAYDQVVLSLCCTDAALPCSSKPKFSLTQLETASHVALITLEVLEVEWGYQQLTC